jgi:TMEM175 potassium channel family protein
VQTTRLEAFSDAVFAIAITLLVLELDVPGAGEGDLWQALLDEWPSFVSYLLSFLVIGIIWVNHHAVLDHVREADRTLLFLNLVFLFWVTFIPFPTAVLAEHLSSGSDEDIATAVYSGTMTLMGISFGVVWLYISRWGHLLVPGISEEAIRGTTTSFVIGSPIYFLAVGIAFVSAPASLAIIALLAVYYALAGRGGGMPSPREQS